ncbi:MAG: helix-turn-helix domain-containing protein [Verrucomicrobia bacterium]|nr:helix-turn-helix domain-containing protein [Verrucomicrobiota bacterium]
MNTSTVLRHAIMERRAVVMPGCHDAMSAKIIEPCGFEAIQISGHGRAAWQQLGNSESVRRFQMAFSVATGLPLTLVPAGLGNDSIEDTEPRGVFCVDGCMGQDSGRWCLRLLQNAERRAAKSLQPVRFQCPAGLLKLLFPVLIGARHAGNLLAGPFSLARLNGAHLRGLTERLKEFGLETQLQRLQVSWRYSPVITTEKLQAVVTLVSMFADYLSEMGNRLLLADASQGSPLLQKIERYLTECQDGDVSLTDVAKRVCVSPCHFCKLFKKQTGLTFSEYRVRRRLEKVRQLLINSQLRISEAAFQAGFESLPYFNRVFRRYVGCSPSEYRARNGQTNQDKKLQIQA